MIRRAASSSWSVGGQQPEGRHSKILRNDFRAVADAVRELASRYDHTS